VSPRSAPVGALSRWLQHQDSAALATLASFRRGWALSFLFVAILFAAVRWEPHLRELTALPLSTALLTFVPLFVTAIAWSLWTTRRPEIDRLFLSVALVPTAALYFFLASLVALSRIEGAIMLSSLLLFAAVYHAHVMRPTVTEPFLFAVLSFSVGAAGLLAPDRAHQAVLFYVWLATLTAMLIVGTVSMRGFRARQRAAAMTTALQAQALDDRNRRVAELHESLSHVVAAQHDANNALVAMLLAIDGLDAIASSDGPVDREELYLLIQEMRDATERVREIFEETKRRGRMSVLSGERTEVQPLVRELVGTIQRRFPSVRMALELGERVDVVRLEGGATTLRRVIENLLVNACEGDGRRGARNVTVRVERNETGGLLCLAVEDDGPGFPAAMLEQPILGFATSKPQGTGLGLFTSAKLLSAHGGQIDRENRAEGGARVTVTLPLAFEAAATERARIATAG
jgi:signal transduction histidine kinase